MAEAKPGEIVKIYTEQIDSNGQKISDISYNLYGFDREMGNVASLGFAAAVLEQAKAFGLGGFEDKGKKGPV